MFSDTEKPHFPGLPAEAVEVDWPWKQLKT